MEKIKKVFSFDIKQIGNESDRMLGFIGSTEDTDRDGDVIQATGWQLDEYNKNPVILGFHEYDRFPYAKSVRTYVDYATKQLRFEVKFPTISELTSFPGDASMIAEHAKSVDLAFNMYKNGYMNAVSVGFIGLESEPILDSAGNWQGKRYTKQSLLELSLVPVPSQPNGLMEARSKGLISDKELKTLQIKKAVVPYHKYALAPEGEAWDGTREIASASVEQLKIMSTWYDAENEDNKGAYKLPHHKADGYTTVWRAVAAAMAALLGARGGVQIPDSDKQGVYNHLAKHYKDFDKEPPEFKSYNDVELKTMFFEEKAGATISAKNRQMMEEAMGHMEIAMGMMREMMAGKPEEEAQMPMEPMKSDMRTVNNEELKTVLDEIKSQVLLLCQKTEPLPLPLTNGISQSAYCKDASKVIDLEAIEYAPLQKDAAKDELNIEPEVLKNMIKEIMSNNLQGGIQ